MSAVVDKEISDCRGVNGIVVVGVETGTVGVEEGHQAGDAISGERLCGVGPGFKGKRVAVGVLEKNSEHVMPFVWPPLLGCR